MRRSSASAVLPLNWWIMAFALTFAAPLLAEGGPISIDDVLAFERLDRVTVSPDGALVAAVVLRGVLSD